MYVISEKLVIIPDYYHGFTLVFSGRTGIIKRFHNSFWKKLTYEQRWGGYIKKRPKLEVLIKSKFLVPKDEDEKTETIRENIRLIDSAQELYWVIMPSADCNLMCDYCGQKHSPMTLSRENCDALVEKLKKILQANNYTQLLVAWFGGEPLLGMDVIRYLTPQFLEICKLLNVTYHAQVATNGTLLTDEIGQELVNNLKVNMIKVTLDGTQNIHDSRKIIRGNKGTYEVITRNISRLAKLNLLNQIHLEIRCNIDSRNIDFAKELVDGLTRMGLETKPHLDFAPVHVWGKAKGQDFAFSMEDYAKHEIKLLEYAIEQGFSMPLIPSVRGSACEHRQIDGITVAPNGHLYKCSLLPLVPVYEHNERDTKWHKKPLLSKEEQDEYPVFDKSVWCTWNQKIIEEKPCSDCNLQGICLGGCPRFKDGDRCPPYKYNIADRMRLFSRKKMALTFGESYDNGKNLFNRIGKLVGIKE